MSMEVLKKLKDFIVSLSADEQTQLETIAAPAAPVAPAPVIPTTLKEVKTKDGLKVLSYDGELAEGVSINDVSTGVPLPAEGDFELEDGTKVSAAAGKVVKVEKPAPVETPAEATAVTPAQMSAIQLAEEKAERESIKSELSRLSAENKTLATILTKVLNTSLAPAAPKKETKELSNFEKLKLKRGEL